MIKPATDMFQLSTKKPRYRITATLLNSWQRIFDVGDNIFSNDSDTESVESKIQDAQKQAKQEFIDLLNRIPVPDNEYMKAGREYEAAVYRGEDTEFSPKVQGGCYQVTVTKNVEIDGLPITLYGVLDVLKAGRIIDIKRVVRYNPGKYKKSHQHAMYLELVPNAIDFTYYVCDNKGKHYYENYIRENSEDILQVISQFLSWLKANDLFEVFIEKWGMK